MIFFILQNLKLRNYVGGRSFKTNFVIANYYLSRNNYEELYKDKRSVRLFSGLTYS